MFLFMIKIIEGHFNKMFILDLLEDYDIMKDNK